VLGHDARRDNGPSSKNTKRRGRHRLGVIAGLAAIVGGLLVSAAPPAHAVLPCAIPGCIIARDDYYTTTFQTKLVVPAATGLLVNDSGSASTSIDRSDTDTESWNGAKVTVNRDGSFTYTPAKGDPFSGLDSFDYALKNNAEDWDWATAYIQVNPILHGDTFSARANHALTISEPGVLANDQGLDPFTVGFDATSAHGGTIDDNDNGAFTYVPPAGFSGTDTFAYTAQDLDWDDTYSANVTVKVDGTPPVATMSAPALVTLSTHVTPKWSATDSSGVASYDVQQNTAVWSGAFQGWKTWKSDTSAKSATLTTTYGRTICFRVRAKDGVGNIGGWVQRCTSVPLRSSGLSYSSGWTNRTSASYFTGTAKRTTTKGQKATRTSVQARRIWLVATKCATCGTLQARWNNVVIATVSLHRTSTAYRQLVPIASYSSVKSGTLTLTVTSATGKPVVIEGLALLRG
jgi:Bacterial Ig domain